MASSNSAGFSHHVPAGNGKPEDRPAAVFDKETFDGIASHTRNLVDGDPNGPAPASDHLYTPNRRFLGQTHPTDGQIPSSPSVTMAEEFPALFDRDELMRIASSMSYRNTTRSPSSSPSRSKPGFDIQRDYAAVDATSSDFDLNKWLRLVVEEVEESGIRQRQTGVTFKQLSVSGSRRALNLQSTVSPVLLSPFQKGGFFDIGPKPHKRILHEFNGIVKEGELLLVLGRPGSGCSTFLKTIAGQYSGLEISESSSIRYNGMDGLH